jgi:hypothetical protein
MEENTGSALSFARDIRPLFRESDVDEMKDISSFDLSKYEDVCEWAASIHARLLDGTMPCDSPWPEEDIARFKRWMDEGMQR